MTADGPHAGDAGVTVAGARPAQPFKPFGDLIGRQLLDRKRHVGDVITIRPSRRSKNQALIPSKKIVPNISAISLVLIGPPG